MTLPVDPHLYLVYLGVMAVMAVTPGPANLFAVATGIARGKRAALVGVAGMNSATLSWFVLAALGLGALVEAFPQAFRLLAYVGAAYVGWLRIKAAMGGLKAQGDGGPSHFGIKPGRSSFRDGFAVQIANPKVLLFFGAVLPPFIDMARPAPPQLALFAAATLILDGAAMAAYGIGGAALSTRMAEPGFRRGFSLFVAALLLTAAVLIALKA